MPCGTRAPKELLHHLPALVLRRPAVSAAPTVMLSGVRGSRLLDRRPPHCRCPAVPGLGTSARAILMALGSSVLPSVINCWYCSTAYCRRPVTAPPFGSRPRCASAPEPHCRTSRCARPQPTPSPRYCTLLHCRYCELHLPILRYCSRRPLITAGHPVRSSVPSPSCNRSGFETPPPHRPAHCNCGYRRPAVHVCRALFLSGLREKT